MNARLTRMTRQILMTEDYSDILVFPGGFDLEVCLPLIGETAARVYIDANFRAIPLGSV